MEQEGNDRTVALCGVQGCCPTAEFTGNSVVIRDDFGGMVTLTKDEWVGFVARAKVGEFD